MKKSQSIKNLLLVTLLSTLFIGCMSFGRLFNSDINWVKKDETTQKDVALVLGQPQEVGNSGGTPTWTYYFYRYKMVGSDARKEIKFYWNDNRTVNHYSFSTSFQEDLDKATSASSN
jgi:hypothetical protein